MDKQTVEYLCKGCFSAIKRRELFIHNTTWINIKITVLRERSQIKKTRQCDNSIHIKPENAKSSSVVAWHGGRGLGHLWEDGFTGG
jgi:hypothetical protein